jgi:putative aldouronate transport system substrate-binding protein
VEFIKPAGIVRKFYIFRKSIGGFMKRIGLVLVILIMTVGLAFGRGQPAAPTSTNVVTVEIFDRGSDGGRSQAHNNAWTNWIKDKVKKDLGIDVTFQPVGRWSETTDIVNLMASGSAPDLCYTYAVDSLANFRDQGGLLDLAPYIDRYLPDMKKLLGADTAIPGQDLIYRDRMPDGKLYSVPNMVVNTPQTNIFIRKDWLDKLGIALPRTTQQFHDALVAFRTRVAELPGNVTAARVVPFGVNSDARWGFRPIIYAFFDPKLSERDLWIANITDRPISIPGFKDGVRLINQWYNENLIYRDFPLMTTADDFYNQIKSGVVGAFAQNWDFPYRTDININVELARNVPGASYVPVDCIQAPDGVNRKYISDKAGMRMFIPSFSKNQVAALRYLNWLCIKENYVYLQIGEAGRNHNMVNGVPSAVTRPAGDPWIMNSANNIDYTMPLNGIYMDSAEANARVVALGYSGTPPETIVSAYNLSIASGRAFPVVSGVVLTKEGQYGATLRDKADALLAQSIRASVAQFDSVWDAGYRDWLASGGTEVINERTTAYPRR